MLKKLFIPHEGNDYKPHILHPKRLLLHGGMAIVIKIIMIFFLLSLPASAWLAPEVLKEDSKKVIALTNNIRLRQGINSLSENGLLDQAALNKAQDMIVNQYFSHMSPSNKNMLNWLSGVGYQSAAAGENLAMGYSSSDEVVAAWVKSKTHYANLIDEDFKEIGVSMFSGNFNGNDTTMVAQYFGSPKIVAKELVLPTLVQQNIEKQGNDDSFVVEPDIKGIKYDDNIGPVVDLEKTKVQVGDNTFDKEKIIRAEAYLSPDALSASVEYKNVDIELIQDTVDPTMWTGSAIIAQPDMEETFIPMVLANLTAKDEAGNVSNTDINWGNFQEIKLSLVSQYSFIKNSSAKEVKALVGGSRIYFSFLLIICFIALVLNVFIEIKKQHPHVIASALGMICLLTILILI